MPDDLPVAVERLRTSTQRLNAAVDATSQLLREVEAFLEESNVGISASVSIRYGASSADADSPDWEDFVSYRRLTGKFRIALVRREVDLPPDLPDAEAVRAWSECSRDEKIEILAALPELLLEISHKVNEKIDRAEQVLAVVAPQVLPVKKRKGGA